MNYILHDITTERFAKEGFRTLALAYKDLSKNDFNRLSSQNNNFAAENDRAVLEQDLTFLAVVALKDDLRDGVKASIKFANKASINVRMISGDSLETAKAVAIEAGILSQVEAE